MRLLFALPLVLVGCLGAFFEPDPTPQVPVWEAGDAWVYRSGGSEATWTVEGRELRNDTWAYRVNITGLGPADLRWFSVDTLAPVAREFLGLRTDWFCSEGPFPLTDKTYTCRVRQGGPGNTDPHRLEVIGETAVSVPAGSYQAVEFVDRFDGGGMRELGRYWYDEGVRHWVAFEVDDVRWELVAARPA